MLQFERDLFIIGWRQRDQARLQLCGGFLFAARDFGEPLFVLEVIRRGAIVVLIIGE